MKPSRPSFPNQGFTLIEILVALTVLILLVIFIEQITSTTTTTIHLSNQHSTTDSDARIAFSRIGQDLQNLVKRSDLDFLAGNPAARTVAGNGNYLFLFFSKAAAAGSPTGGNRKVSLIGYQIGASADNSNLPCLLRAGQSIGWSTSGFMGLNSKGMPVRFGDTGFPTSLLPSTSAVPSDFDVMAPGIIRMVVGFQLYPDNQAVTMEDGSTVADGSGGKNARGQWVYSPPIRTLTPLDGSAAVPYTDLSRISSILVGFVVLDRATIKLLNASQVTQIANQFVLPQANQLPLQAWNATLNSLTGSLSAAVPLPALQSARIYQCVYPITPAGSLFGQ